MKLLTDPEHRHALSDRQVELEKSSNLVRLRYSATSDFFNLAKVVVDPFGSRALVLYIDEWGIWPSSENWTLYNALCQFYFGRLSKVDPIQCERTESSEATMFLEIALRFGWGGSLLAEDGGGFRFNHDGFSALISIAVDPVRVDVPGVVWA